MIRRLLVTCLVAALTAALTWTTLPAPGAQAARGTRLEGWAPGARLTARAGEVVTVRVGVRPATAARPRTVVLQRRADGGRWARVAVVRTDRGGVARLRVPTTRVFTGQVRVAVRATRGARGALSSPRSLVVRPTPTTTPTEAEVVRLVNVARASARRCGDRDFAATTPLRTDDRLSRASRDHALDMGTQDYFSHTSLDGRSPWDRARAAGYATAGGENIAAGHGSPEEVVAGWLASAGHCQNLMSPEMVDIGVGFAEVPESTYGTYWVQLFGRG